MEFNVRLMSANNVFKGVVKQIRQSSRDRTSHYPPISSKDQQILKRSAAQDPGNPKDLLNKVWYSVWPKREGG